MCLQNAAVAQSERRSNNVVAGASRRIADELLAARVAATDSIAMATRSSLPPRSRLARRTELASALSSPGVRRLTLPK